MADIQAVLRILPYFIYMGMRSEQCRQVMFRLAAILTLLVPITGAYAQTPTRAIASHNASGAIVISLDEAIQRARKSDLAYAAARANLGTSAIDSYLAKAALLPTAAYHNQLLYTQPNGRRNQGGQVGNQAAPIFIANNAIREYASQASINETIGLKQFADVKAADANAAQASAELEIARRGLVATVVSLYYSVSDAETKEKLMTEAFREAQAFTNVTRERESEREVAHSDVVKAELQQEQREIDLSNAKVAAETARLNLAVLLFSDPRTPYKTQPLAAIQPLPTRDEVNAEATTHNPELKSAMAALKASDAGVEAAWASYLPDLALNFNYGIDAPQFAVNGPEGVKNLGYSISGTLDLPVWNWFSTQKKVKQSEIRRSVAQVALTATQRSLIANLEEAYAHAAAAHDQLALLDESVHTAKESLHLTNLRYEAGEATVLEVVDAQNAAITAQNAQADGVVQYETALAYLQILTGKL
ncbi:MAG TPA: TolC family protein [Acidobacteriaceae bacterium]|nr:TolC family protein [Acidobacteriaceae bacterium]